MTDTNRGTVRVTLRLTREVKAKLEARAAEARMTVSAYVGAVLARVGHPDIARAEVRRRLEHARAEASAWRKGEGK